PSTASSARRTAPPETAHRKVDRGAPFGDNRVPCPRPRRRGSERTALARRAGCMKCGSLFIEIEPAFVHCRYCGSLSRIRGTSLLAQEEYEMRSGLRLPPHVSRASRKRL